MKDAKHPWEEMLSTKLSRCRLSIPVRAREPGCSSQYSKAERHLRERSLPRASSLKPSMNMTLMTSFRNVISLHSWQGTLGRIQRLGEVGSGG